MAIDQVTPGAPPRPKMTLGGKGDPVPEFLGIVALDEWQESKFGGYQWKLMVKPVDFDLKGETGCYHTYYKYSTKKNSALGKAREAMQEVFPADLEIGEKKLEGQVCWWTRRDISFGVNRSTGEEMLAEDVLIPVRLADAEEVARAQARGTGPRAETTPATTAKAETLGDEEIKLVKELVDGKTALEINKAVVADKTMNKSIKQGIISGTLLDTMVEQGHIYLDGEVYLTTPF